MSLKLPSTLKVGHLRFKVENWKDSEAWASMRWGECDKMAGVIRIADGITDDRKKEVLIHEILHAIWDLASLPTEGEEEVVSRLAGPLTMVLNDNPKLKDLFK